MLETKLPRLRIRSLALLGLVATASAFGGGRVRNGGLGMECKDPAHPDKTTIVLLDAFERNLTENWSELRGEFGAKIYKRLFAVEPAFADRWHAEWLRLGSSASWSATNLGDRSYDDYLPFDPYQIPGCRLIQLSVFDDSREWMPRRVIVHWDRATARTRRSLELHESLYVIAVRDFAHTNPVRVRALVGALLADDVAELPRLLDLFQSRAPVAEDRDGFYRSIDENASCPTAIALEDTHLDGLQMVIVYRIPTGAGWSVTSIRFSDSDRYRWNQITRSGRREDGVEWATVHTPYNYLEVSFETKRPGYLVADFRAAAPATPVTGPWEARGCEYHRSLGSQSELAASYFRRIHEAREKEGLITNPLLLSPYEYDLIREVEP